MIGLDPNERTKDHPAGVAATPERDPIPPREDESLDDAWDEDDWENWLFL